MIGILMLWGITGTFTFDGLSEFFNGAHPKVLVPSVTVLSISILLIFMGAMGKSAQAPLHVWLPDAKCQECDRHLFLKSAHLPDVLLVMAGIDDGTGSEEQERLKPGVCEEVKHSGFRIKQTNGHDHVSELGESGVSEDFFDIVLLGRHEGS